MDNLENRKRIFNGLQQLALAYDQIISEERIVIYTENLIQYGIDQIKNSLRQCFEKNVRFPSLAEILNYINPELEKKEEANEITGAIIECMRDFGRYRTGEVYHHVGPTGTLAIKRFGGWDLICNTPEVDMGTARAQLRDIVISILSSKNRPESQCQLPYQRQTRTMLLGEGLNLLGLENKKKLEGKPFEEVVNV
jgi:hypothetical protein